MEKPALTRSNSETKRSKASPVLYPMDIEQTREFQESGIPHAIDLFGRGLLLEA